MLTSDDIIKALFSIRKQDLDGFYAAMPTLQLISQVPQMILNNAIESYAPNCKPEDAVVLIDTSTASNGRAGMIFSKQGFYCSMMRIDVFNKQKIEQPILYENIKLAEVHSNNVHIVFKNGFSQTGYGGNYTEFITVALNKLRKLAHKHPSPTDFVFQNNNYSQSFSGFNYKKELEKEKEKLQENYNQKLETEKAQLQKEYSEKLNLEKVQIQKEYSEKLNLEKAQIQKEYSEKLNLEKAQIQKEYSEKLNLEKAQIQKEYSEKLNLEKAQIQKEYSEKLNLEIEKMQKVYQEQYEQKIQAFYQEEKEKARQMELYQKITSRRSLVPLHFSDFVT